MERHEHLARRGDIGARLERQVDVGDAGGLADARVGDDDRLVRVLFEPAAKDRVIVGDVRADQEHHVHRLASLRPAD